MSEAGLAVDVENLPRGFHEAGEPFVRFILLLKSECTCNLERLWDDVVGCLI